MDKGYTLKWTPKVFKEQVKEQIATNGQEVGGFVQARARQKLNNISDPDWGKKYRSMVAGLIGYEVIKNSNDVTIWVGVRPTYTDWHGYWIEVGTARRAQHPFLRPSVFDNLNKIKAIIES